MKALAAETSALVSQPYRDTLRAMHASRPWGNKGHRHIPDFIGLFAELGCKNLLDYGSGTERLRLALATSHPDISVVCYDPGVTGREVLPQPADFVVSTDVLEHVEPGAVDAVLDHLCSLTVKGAYLRIALTKAKRSLPDGRNAHLTIRSGQWWLEKLRSRPWKLVRQGAGRKTLKAWLTRSGG